MERMSIPTERVRFEMCEPRRVTAGLDGLVTRGPIEKCSEC